MCDSQDEARAVAVQELTSARGWLQCEAGGLSLGEG